jgi:hypothetical protein
MVREAMELVAAVERVATSCPRKAMVVGEVRAEAVMLLAARRSAEKEAEALRDPAAVSKVVLRVVKRGVGPVSARLLRTVRLDVVVFTRASLIVMRELVCTREAVAKFVLMEYVGARRVPLLPTLEMSQEVEMLELPIGKAVPGG